MNRTHLKVAIAAVLGVLLLTGSTALATVGWAGAGSPAVVAAVSFASGLYSTNPGLSAFSTVMS